VPKFLKISFVFFSIIVSLSTQCVSDELINKSLTIDTATFNKIYHTFEKYYESENYDSAYYYGQQVVLHSYNLFERKKSITYSYMGEIAQRKNLYTDAIFYYKEAMAIYNKTDDYKSIASINSTIGYLLYVTGEYEEASVLLSKNESFCFKHNLKTSLARTYMGLGFVYRGLNAFGKGLEFFSKYLEIAYELDNYQDISTALNEIGNVYLLSGDYEKAISYQIKSIEVKEEYKDTLALCYSYNDISLSYKYLGKYDLALEYLLKSETIAINFKYDYVLTAVYINIADIYNQKGDFTKAEIYLNKALAIALGLNLKSELSAVYAEFSRFMAEKGDYKKAYEYQELTTLYADSLLNENVHKQLNELAAKYEFDKKQKEIALLSKDQLLQQNKITQQKYIQYTLIFGIVVFVIVLIILVNRYQIKQRANKELARKNEEIFQQKEEISSQRDEIEYQRDKLLDLNSEISTQRDQVTLQRDEIVVKNKEINDSLNYAKRIQQALLPDISKIFNEINSSLGELGEPFVFFRPKDIVSGDFYWIRKKNNKVFLTVADCTGHGVPGAFMSILGISALNEIINNNITESSQILLQLKAYIINSLHQTGKMGEMQDGMDMAFCIIDSENRTIDFAGANNSLYIVKSLPSSSSYKVDEKTNSNFMNFELYELKGDKMPLGIHVSEKPFKSVFINYLENDRIYLFTDGYKDQIGGVNNKKLKTVNFKNKILQISLLSMTQQKEELTNYFEQWKGSNEQVDDVLVLGIKLK